jgi:hypothetical protein
MLRRKTTVGERHSSNMPLVNRFTIQWQIALKNDHFCRGFSFLRTVASIHAATNPNRSKASISNAGPLLAECFV